MAEKIVLELKDKDLVKNTDLSKNKEDNKKEIKNIDNKKEIIQTLTIM